MKAKNRKSTGQHPPVDKGVELEKEKEIKEAFPFTLKKIGAAEPSSPARRGFGLLEATSFLCGACVMVLEMTGSRLVAPFLGTSLVVWTALIGVIMASLCAGNWAGGLLADRCPERRQLEIGRASCRERV